MALTYTDALNLARSLLNASTGSAYTVNDDTDRHPDQEIMDAIRGADALIYTTVATTPGHSKRSKYLTPSANIPYAGEIPEHVGPIGAVLIAGGPAYVLPAAEIGRLKTNTLSLTDATPYYDVVGNTLFYVPGSTATVEIVPPYNDQGGSLQSPQEYFQGVVALALAMLFGKEGAEVEAAQFYQGYGDMVMKLIQSNAEQLPDIVAYQKSN